MLMIEGTWRGYRSSQDLVCHREYLSVNKANRNLVEWLRKSHSITFTDGTELILDVIEVAKRKDKAIDGYGKLIRDCYYAKVNSVQGLMDKNKAAKQGAAI